MPRLPLCLDYITGETAFSFASRLAARNGLPMSEFLSDMGIKFNALQAGDLSVLGRIADIGDAPLDALRDATPVEVAPRIYQLLGHEFPVEAVRAKEVRGCPDCLRQDAAVAGEPSMAMATRGHWLVSHYNICHRHGRPLVTLWSEHDPAVRYDTVMCLRKITSELMDNLIDAPFREPSEFDIWLNGRLRGPKQPAVWFDKLPLHAVSVFCREIGRTTIATKLPKWRKLREADAWWPYAVGFLLCHESQDRIGVNLGLLQRMMGTPEGGPKKIFGGLYDLLADGDLADGFLGFRDVLRNHIEMTWPLGPGHELMGEPVLRRRHHSVVTAARAVGRPADTVRAALNASDVLKNVDETADDAWDVFQVRDSASVLKELNVPVSEVAFAAALSIPIGAFANLRDDGIFDVARLEGKGDNWDVMVGRHHIEQILLGAETVYVAMHEWFDVCGAARQLGVQPSEIWRRIRNGQLARIGHYVQRDGFAAIVVDLAGLTDGTDELSVDIVARSKGLKPADLGRLLGQGHTPCRTRQGPRSGKLQVVLSGEDLVALNERFISLRELGLAAGLSWSELRACLAFEAIAPFSPDGRNYGPLYQRQDVQHLIAGQSGDLAR